MSQGPAGLVGVVSEGVLVLTLQEEHLRDVDRATSIRNAATTHVDEAQPSRIVFDLGRLQSIGSVGLLAFLGLRRHFAQGPIVLTNMSSAIEKTFSLFRLIPTDTQPVAPFEVAPTVADAMKGRAI